MSPHTRQRWQQYLRFWRVDVKADVDDELRFHLEMREHEYVVGGLSPTEARRAARGRFGDVTGVREQCYSIGYEEERTMRASELIRSVVGDIDYALRQMARNRGFALTAIATLALGIGATSIVFGLVDAMLLHPLPAIDDPGQLVEVTVPSVSYPSYRDFAAATPSFSGLAGFSTRSMSVSDHTNSGLANVGVVTGNYFAVVGTKPFRGRLLGEGDDAVGAPIATVVSPSFARRFFGTDQGLVGRTLELNGGTATIVGVAEDEFHGTRLDDAPGLWIGVHAWMDLAPSSFAGLTLQTRGWEWLTMIGRLRSGASMATAKAELNRDAAVQEQGHPHEAPTGFKIHTIQLATAAAVGGGREMIVTMSVVVAIVVGLVLLIACANVSNLLLARAVSRQREVGIRVAIGAGRGRLVRQLITEAFVLALCATAVGLGGAALVSRALSAVSLTPGFSLATLHLHVDLRVASFAVAMACGACLLFGLAPTLQSTRADVLTALKGGSSARAGRPSRLRMTLVVAQVALSAVLLIGAGLFTRGLQRALSVDPGFNGDRVAVATTDVGLVHYDSTRARQFYRAVLARLDAMPGVRAVAWGQALPLDVDQNGESFTVDGYVARPKEQLETEVASVSPRYFDVFSIPLLDGRSFDDHDVAGAPRVAVINQTMARRYWAHGSPVGRTIVLASDTLRVVGVVRDIKYHELREEPQSMVYRLLDQVVGLAGSGRDPMSVAVATTGRPELALAAIRRVLLEVAVDVPAYDAQTFEERAGHTVFVQRVGVSVLGLFSILALLIAAVGISGVVSYAVTQRTREIGIRMALGAQRGTVLWVVLADNLMAVGVGLAVGLGAGLLLSVVGGQAMSGVLFGVSPGDVGAFAGAALVLAIVAIIAAVIPARRATRIDPVRALRTE